MIVGAPLFCRRLVGREREFAALRRTLSGSQTRPRIARYCEWRGWHRQDSLPSGSARENSKQTARRAFAASSSSMCRRRWDRSLKSFASCTRCCRPRSTSRPHRRVFGAAESGSIDSVIFDSRASQFASIAETLLRCAATTPLVIAIEDIHWADPATLECLQYLASRVEGARLLFILTYRSASLDRKQCPAAEYSKLTHQANVWQLALEPLERREMQALVNETLPANASTLERRPISYP